MVASNLEIERVLAKIRLAEECLRSMVTPFSLLGQGVADLGEGLSSPFGFEQAKSIAVGLELPALIQKLQHLELACLEASRAYFQGETEIAAELPNLAEAVMAAGVFRETGVQVREVGADGLPVISELGGSIEGGHLLTPQKSPDRLAELIWHLQRTDEHSKNQIRVDRLAPIGGGVGPGGQLPAANPLFIAYVPGTQEWAVNAGDNAFDATSNVAAMASPALAASERGVEQALVMAGAVAGARVLLVGHSQGGLIAARLAANQDFNVTDVLTAGAPIERLTLPASVRVTTVDHTNDVIPALGAAGVAAVGAGAASAPASAVRIREPFAPGLATRELPAHRLSGYVQTAHRMDANTDPLLRQRKSQLTAIPASAQCSATEYTATRPNSELDR